MVARCVDAVDHVDAITFSPQQDLQHLAQARFIITDKNTCGHDP
jgi:hypothetical protein